VRLPAQVLRLSRQGESVGSIAAYAGRSQVSILRDLARWKQRGFQGLAEGTVPGYAPAGESDPEEERGARGELKALKGAARRFGGRRTRRAPAADAARAFGRGRAALLPERGPLRGSV
jgi:hypothetical protein